MKRVEREKGTVCMYIPTHTSLLIMQFHLGTLKDG